MAAAEYSVNSIAVKIQLNNGTSASGQVKTVAVPIGGTSQKIRKDTYTADLQDSRDGVATIALALAPIFSKSVYRLTEITEGNLAL